MVLALLTIAAMAGDVYRPESHPPPGRTAALDLLEGLMSATAGPVDVDWLKTHVRPTQLPAAPPESWYAQLAQSLGPDGAVGGLLRRTDGPSQVVDGPAYTRIILEGTPRLTLTVRVAEQQQVVFDEITVTSCTLCPEPVRFVRDLLWDVQRKQHAEGRLLPGIEMMLDAAIASRGTSWLALLQTRNQKGRELTRLLVGAQVIGAEGEIVQIRYADGSEDTWTIGWKHETWQLDYDALPPESPLRLSRRDSEQWRNPHYLQQLALGRWSPTWHSLESESGLFVGAHAIGAQWDPRDDTLLIAVMGLDRILAGVIRVDPWTRSVTERIPLPPPTTGTQMDLGDWSGRWHFRVSPDATLAAVSMPGRLWQIDLRSHQTSLLTSAGKITTLHFAQPQEGDQWSPLVVARQDALTVYRSAGMTWIPVEGTPLAVDDHDGTLLVTTTAGELQELSLLGKPLNRLPLCCDDGLLDTALRPNRAEFLVACPLSCRTAVERVSRIGHGRTRVEGAGARRRGTSWSTNGQLYTTPAQGEESGLLLWRARDDLLLARFATSVVPAAVAWSQRSDWISVVDTRGEVTIWDVRAIVGQGTIRKSNSPP